MSRLFQRHKNQRKRDQAISILESFGVVCPDYYSMDQIIGLMAQKGYEWDEDGQQWVVDRYDERSYR